MKSLLGNILHGIENRLRFVQTPKNTKLNISWLLTKYYKHLPPGKIRIHRLLGKDLYYISPQELLHGINEIFTQEIYKQTLPQNPLIIDCGANIGLSVIYMKHHYPDAKIIAFEPDEINFDLLKKNVLSFGYEGVTLYREAVWSENTILHFSNDSSMSSKIEMTANNNSIEVKAKRLKELLNQKIDFLKIDIEGAEYIVLNDIADKLHFVNNMFVEYHGLFNQNQELSELFCLINKSGFSYYIKEAANIFKNPFSRGKGEGIPYEVQLNIFCFRA